MEEQYIKNLIERIKKDERIKNREGEIIPYYRYAYKHIFSKEKYTEVLQQGFKISCLVNEYTKIPTYISLYVLVEEYSNVCTIKNIITKKTYQIELVDEKRIINTILSLLLEKEEIVFKKVN